MLNALADKNLMHAVKRGEGAGEDQGGRGTLVNEGRSHCCDNHEAGYELNASVIEVVCFAGGVERMTRELSAISLIEAVPLHLVIAAREPKQEILLEALDVAEGE